MNLVLPKKISIRTLPSTLAFFASLFHERGEEIHIDCSEFVFTDPMGLCFLRYHLDLVTYLDCTVHLDGLSDVAAAYLERMNFFSDLADGVYCSNRPKQQSRANLDHLRVEMTKIGSELEIDSAAGRLAKAMVGASAASSAPDPEGMRPSPADRLHTVLQYVFSELINNAAFHGRARGRARSEIWVAAQYYNDTGNVRLAILDDGCGFLDSLRGHSALEEETDAAAIEAALRPRVSCNRDLARGLDSANQGIGLTASKELTLAAKGTVDIFSGGAWYRETPQAKTFRPMRFGWQGVGVALTMERALLQEIEIASIISNIAPLRERRSFNFE
ncbi:ATP-binding protein [Paraburkholderia antibiotica]|uniref:Sensor histidine kinase n=1 Tax=Paraburkholderia antibiotica TaxID=2728839 RepID=A0A7Y0A044_9BURK|nr:ATP-binding protein [Paraburkholderia antibiotica]NML34031.1 sensor histidine kinase [Paraburkholderia antibiotica]